jgi:hypothetical protein
MFSDVYIFFLLCFPAVNFNYNVNTYNYSGIPLTQKPDTPEILMLLQVTATYDPVPWSKIEVIRGNITGVPDAPEPAADRDIQMEHASD